MPIIAATQEYSSAFGIWIQKFYSNLNFFGKFQIRILSLLRIEGISLS